MYRVVPRDTNTNKSIISDGSKLLLFHGTKVSNVKGILKEGFMPSKNARFGPGVYMTNDYGVASRYSDLSYVNHEGVVKKNRYIFVNQVQQVEGNFFYEFEKHGDLDEDKLFEKYLKDMPIMGMFDTYNEEQISIPKDCSQTKYDSNNSKIISGTFRGNYGSEVEVLAHHDLVVPAYLIETQFETISVDRMVNELLYDIVEVKR